MTRAYQAKALLIAVPLILGVAAVSANSITAPHQAGVQAHKITTPDPTPSPSAKPQVTVNGKKVPTDAHGNLDMTLPDAHIKVSNGHTTVTSNNNNSNSSTSVNGNNIDIRVHSDSSNGTSRSTTHIESSQTNRSGTSNGSSTTTTHVFSSGSTNVTSQP